MTTTMPKQTVTLSLDDIEAMRNDLAWALNRMPRDDYGTPYGHVHAVMGALEELLPAERRLVEDHAQAA